MEAQRGKAASPKPHRLRQAEEPGPASLSHLLCGLEFGLGGWHDSFACPGRGFHGSVFSWVQEGVALNWILPGAFWKGQALSIPSENKQKWLTPISWPHTGLGPSQTVRRWAAGSRCGGLALASPQVP